MEYIIKLNLEVPNGLCIDGTVHSYERRNPGEYRISHIVPGTKDEILGPHYVFLRPHTASLTYHCNPAHHCLSGP